MSHLRADAVAVYVFRRTPGIELLQLRRADPKDVYPGTWQPVYGGMDEGETAVEAAFRELHEETGLRPRSFFQVEHLESFYFRPTDHVVVMPVFGAEVAEDAKVALDAEHDDHRWVPATEVESAFMWRSQREAVAVLLAQLQRGGLAHEVLQIPLPDPPAPPREA